jgi:hypothetical protein
MYKRDEGNVSILVSLIFIILMVSTAFVMDFGVIYAEKAKLVKAMDAAILAGGQVLPDQTDEARSVMEEYLLENHVSLDQVEIYIAEDGMTAEIRGYTDVPHFFGKVIGFTETRVNAKTKIALGSLTSVKGGIRPFGVESFDYSYGDIITLKAGGGDGYNGNYGALALGGRGASVLIDNALYGYDGELKIGDFIDTEPGNMASLIPHMKSYINSIPETFNDYSPGSDRIWTIPLLASLDVSGRDQVEIVGFGQFFIEDVQKKSGKAELKGRFIQYVSQGDINFNQVSKGALGMKLVE